MSCKIYNGYIINSNNLSVLHGLSLELKTKFKTRALHKIRKLVCNICVSTYDDILSNKSNLTADDRKQQVISYASSIIYKRVLEVKKNNYNDPSVDIFPNWVFIPHPTQPDKTLALFYGTTEFSNLWKQHPLIKPYYYWDNTDKPKGISAKSWAEREHIWEIALGDNSPSTMGLSFEIYGAYDFPSYPSTSEVINFQPTFKTRATYIATELARNVFWKQHQHTLPSTADGDLSGVSALLRKSNQWLATDEGKAEHARCLAELKTTLPQRYTITDFRKEISTIK